MILKGCVMARWCTMTAVEVCHKILLGEYSLFSHVASCACSSFSSDFSGQCYSKQGWVSGATTLGTETKCPPPPTPPYPQQCLWLQGAYWHVRSCRSNLSSRGGLFSMRYRSGSRRGRQWMSSALVTLKWYQINQWLSTFLP